MNIAQHPYNSLRSRFGASLTDHGFDLLNRWVRPHLFIHTIILTVKLDHSSLFIPLFLTGKLDHTFLIKSLFWDITIVSHQFVDVRPFETNNSWRSIETSVFQGMDNNANLIVWPIFFESNL